MSQENIDFEQTKITCSYCDSTERPKYIVIRQIRFARFTSFEPVNSVLNSEDISEPICENCYQKIKQQLPSFPTRKTAQIQIPNIGRQTTLNEFFGESTND